MVDPVQVALGALAGRAAQRTLNAILGPETVDANPQLHLTSVATALPQPAGTGIAAIVTEHQMDDIDAFLRTREAASLIQSWCILTIAADKRKETRQALEEIESAFHGLAQQWNASRDVPWESISIDIWRLVTAGLGHITGAADRSTLSTKQRNELLKSIGIKSELVRGKQSATPAFVRRLLAAVSTTDRIDAIKRASADICREYARLFSEIHLNHVHDDYRFRINQLYVARTLSSHHSGEQHNSEEVLDGKFGLPRTVIVGDPGVGKSTLIGHLIHILSSRADASIAPVLIQCRDYVGTAWGSRLTEFIANKLSTILSAPISEDVIIDLLAVGSAYLIFDGVDEITDIQRRREFIRTIESLVTTYPLVPIAATSRRVGYSRAKFAEDMFHLFDLDEFTEDQFYEYVDKWFSITNREPSDRESFIRESGSVDDIRCNPLMLSLLCTLYRARGHIPRNRRQVYRDCCDLLFSRWDAMRHVEQPFDHRRYGERLMQELARFYYRSQTAQAGVEETQLVRLIAGFFRDTASVEPPDDATRAKQFLDFCADRAWLLTAKGSNERGIRLFGFTHRTFMEYLAAEALTRRSSTLDEVIDEITKIFLADPSSVLPDILVQCVDDKFDRGAERILQMLLDRGRKMTNNQDKYLSLCLRIVNASPMSRAVSKTLPMEIWTLLDEN